MSLILDALRKSEHQRQRQVGPGLSVVPESQSSQRPATWVLALGGLLLLNVAVVAALLLTSREPEVVATAPPAPARVSEPVATAPAERVRPAPVTLPAKPPRSEVRPLTTEVAAPAPAPAVRTESVTSAGAGPVADSRPAAQLPVDAAPPRASTSDARLPRFADLVVRGEMNVPHMHIDIHVYSATPAERFVFINMRRYNEGQAIQEGPRIEQITSDGVVMDYQGQRFFLSRD